MGRPKKSDAQEPVRIRFKQLADGNKSIYLASYINKKRTYEFLKLYLIPETDAASRAQNEHTMKAANAIKAQRILEIANNTRAMKEKASKAKISLMDWLDRYLERQQIRGKRSAESMVHTAKMYFGRYNGKINICDIDKDYIQGFIKWMERQKKKDGKPFAKRSILHPIACVRASLNYAIEQDLIYENPVDDIDFRQIEGEETKREYLTIEEIKKLIATPCKREDIKRAFLFSCFCGLRLGDVRTLRWKDLHEENGELHVEIRQHKTEKMVYIPLNKNARIWIPERGDASEDDLVFSSRLIIPQNLMREWANAAGITKKISYHVSRHSFATMALTTGTDIYTTSNLMGHTDIATTQIYAKIVDTKKDEAIARLDNEFAEFL